MGYYDIENNRLYSYIFIIIFQLNHKLYHTKARKDFVIIQITDEMKNNIIYEGTTRKFGVSINGSNYMVKFAKDNDLSVFCEYIASNFINEIGFSCQKVALGSYNGEMVNIVYDFASNENKYLHSFKDTKQSSENTDIGDKEYTYDDVIYLIDKHLKLSPDDKLKTKCQFWQMYICDAILANRDRHWGNWGYLGQDGDNYYTPAPIYDNGACLYPGVRNAIAEMNKDRKKFFYDRVFVFPASLFMVEKTDRTYRTNYFEIFSDLRFNKVFAEEVKAIRERMDYKTVFKNISQIVNSIEFPIEENIGKFWIEIVTLRYMCIILRKDFDKSFSEVERMIKGI